MLVRILFLVLAIAAALVHGYRFRHFKKKLQRNIDGLSEDLLFKGGGMNGIHESTVVRQKRVSDQRLAELETLVALSNMKGNIKTIPYGFGSVDPRKIGRKRRSSSPPGVLLDRLFESIAREEEEENSSQDRPVIQWPPYIWTDQDAE